MQPYQQYYNKMFSIKLKYFSMFMRICAQIYDFYWKGFRKVIFATNIAETSITIPNIKYVVDTGKVKSRSFNSKTGFEALKVQTISKAQAFQRSGRAGRLMRFELIAIHTNILYINLISDKSGVCYRLYTKEEYDAFRNHTIPEIQRTNLTNGLLHLIAIGINDIFKFDFIDKPSEEVSFLSVSFNLFILFHFSRL